jgi:hypothetical protein
MRAYANNKYIGDSQIPEFNRDNGVNVSKFTLFAIPNENRYGIYQSTQGGYRYFSVKTALPGPPIYRDATFIGDNERFIIFPVQ